MFRGFLSPISCALVGLLMTASQSLGQMPTTELPLAHRIAGRSFPSVFQAWNPADNLQEDARVTEARHDLIFHGARFFRLKWNAPHEGVATGFTPASITNARQRRQELLARNPHLVLLLEIRYRDAHRTFLPDGHPWWRRDGAGKLVMGWEEGGYIQLDFAKPAYREQVATQAQAAVQSGVVDGIMLDWWDDDDARLALIQAIRARIGEQALILVNANDRTTPRTAPFVNGYFMECYRSRTAQEWARIATTLEWAERHLRAPRINCLESWYHQSRADEPLMRTTTTLSLTLSDGYCLFADPNPLPTPDHRHNWYPFWEKTLGQPLAAGVRQPNGSIHRVFSQGTVVYNPLGNGTVEVTFATPRTSVATGKTALMHRVAGGDGDLFLVNEPVRSGVLPK
jgi:hypothetical protein